MIDGETVDNGNEQISSESSKSLSYVWNAIKGTHTVKVKLDNSDPAETTENNNEVTKDIEIEEPKENFEFKSISWNDPLYQGEETTITVTLENSGGKDGNTIVSTYADGNMIHQESIEIASGQENYVVFAWTPYEVGSIELSAEIEDNAESISKYAYVQEPEEENIMPVALATISVNGILKSNSLVNIVKVGDQITFDGMNSYDSDGSIVSFSWNIDSSGVTLPFNNAQQQFDYIFEIATSYTITLTVTDNLGGINTWQGSVIVEEKLLTNTGESEDGSNLLLYGSGAAVVLGLLGVVGLRYFRNEEEDDWGNWEEAAPESVNLQCPNCSGLITITTDQRPIQVGCPMCQAQFVIRE